MKHSNLTTWGGQRGAVLPAAAQTVGTRIVTEHGEHGVITHPPGYSIHLGGVPLDGGHTSARLDNGVDAYLSTPTIFAEVRRPDPARVEPGLPFLNTNHRYTPPPDRRMSPGQLYRALLSAQRDLKITSWPEQVQQLRTAMQTTLSPLLRWVEAHPDHRARAEISDRALALLRYDVEGAYTPFAAREQEILRGLRRDWLRDYRVGDGVGVLEGPAGDYDSGWSLAAIEGEHAIVTKTGQRRRTPLWRLRVEAPAGRARLTDDQPVSLDALLYDNLAHPYDEVFDGSRLVEDVKRALREPLPRVLRAWLGELGLDVKVERSYDYYTVTPRRGAFSEAEVARLVALLPAVTWSTTGGGFDYEPHFGRGFGPRRDLQLGPEFAERLAMMLSESLRGLGFRASRTGEERRVEAARSCQTLAFELSGHGLVRVDCGDPVDPAAWHNLYIKDRRFAWGAGQWMKGKVPPIAVLEAVRERGIRVFG